MITDRLSKLRSLIEEKSVVSVVSTFPHTRESYLLTILNFLLIFVDFIHKFSTTIS